MKREVSEKLPEGWVDHRQRSLWTRYTGGQHANLPRVVCERVEEEGRALSCPTAQGRRRVRGRRARRPARRLLLDSLDSVVVGMAGGPLMPHTSKTRECHDGHT